jgi:hypothetical protein
LKHTHGISSRRRLFLSVLYSARRGQSIGARARFDGEPLCVVFMLRNAIFEGKIAVFIEFSVKIAKLFQRTAVDDFSESCSSGGDLTSGLR